MNNKKRKSYKIVCVNGVNISYQFRSKLNNGPKVSVIFLPGYKSDMQGTKAIFLNNLSKKIGYEFLRLDYSGHGLSEGKIENQLISDWINEIIFLVKKKLNYPIIIVGSSLGGWLAIILLQKLSRSILGFIGIGSAPDFTNDIIKNLTLRERKRYLKDGYISIESNYEKQPYVFTREFIENAEKNFVLTKSYNVNCKIILLYGLLDNAVTLEKQIKLLKILKTKEARLIIVKNSDHRMSSRSDLKLLEQTVLSMIKSTL